jgi:hypothetical protein
MRTWIALGLLAALAWPATAREATPCERAEDLLSDVQTERFRLEGVSTRTARTAARHLRKGEKAIQRLIDRYEGDEGIDHKKLALFTRAGKWIERARSTGSVADDAAPVTGWNAWFDGCMADVDEAVIDAAEECDRIWTERLRAKVLRRLDKGLALYDAARFEERALRRAGLMVRAMEHVAAAHRKAEKFCDKESRPNAGRGLVVNNYLLTYRGRGNISVFDLEWSVTLRTREGVVVDHREGHLSDPKRILDHPLPWRMERGDTLNGLDAASIPFGFGHRMDGVLIWRTSAGDVEVPIHIDQ